MSNPAPFDNLEDRPAIESLRERDIDLLVCGELHLNPGPLQELLVGGWNNGMASFQGAWVSHLDGNDETDILAKFRDGPRILILLIENKIDAVFQPRQPERYRERAERAKEHGGAGCEVQTILLAPARYSTHRGTELFDRRVSYEEVIEVLAQTSDARSIFLAGALRNGIGTQRRGYVAEHDELRTGVWNAFSDIAEEETPQLHMKREDSKPAGAGFIEFRGAEGVSRVVDVTHQVAIVYKYTSSSCHVDIQFGNITRDTLDAEVHDLLETDVTVEKARRSASIRLQAPFVNFDRPPEGQEAAIGDGLDAAERLRLFFIEKGLKDLVFPE